MDEMKEPMEASTKGADNPVTKGEGGKKHTVEGEDPGSLCAKGGEVRGAEGGRQPSDATPLSANDVLKQLETQVSAYRFTQGNLEMEFFHKYTLTDFHIHLLIS